MYEDFEFPAIIYSVHYWYINELNFIAMHPFIDKDSDNKEIFKSACYLNYETNKPMMIRREWIEKDDYPYFENKEDAKKFIIKKMEEREKELNG